MPAKNIKLLLFSPHGSVQLLSSGADQAEVLWTSDEDHDFPEEFDDILDPNDEEDIEHIVEYLIDKELLADEESIDIEEQFLDEDADEDEEEDDE
jgi:hypothetical protein